MRRLTFATHCFLSRIELGASRVDPDKGTLTRTIGDEIYLRGPNLIEAVNWSCTMTVQSEDQAEVATALCELAERGILESRGPQAWVIYDGPPKTKAQVVPNRQWFFQREQGHCFYCWCDLTATPMHIDHVFPKSRGGWDDAANLVASCESCNLKKGAKSLVEWCSPKRENR